MSQTMPDLDDAGFEILRVAVREARDRQIRSLKDLREHLTLLFPGRDEDSNRAIAYWAASVRQTAIRSHAKF